MPDATDVPDPMENGWAAERRFSERAHRVIPGGSHTYSRGDDQFPRMSPRGFVRGKGARVWSVSGREYIDWGMGINNVLIGHAEGVIDDAAVAAIREGVAFSRPSPLEVDAAERLLALFPGMDMVKFAKNGSDANDAAIRLARAVTGRELIAYDRTAPFLSIHDWFIGTTVMDAGVPRASRHLSVPFVFNDVASVERIFSEHDRMIAAVIMEVCRDVRPTAEFLRVLQRLCIEQGTLLVFDEIVTGFRYALHGAHSLFGIVPDLLTLGKGMANGYALAALLGRREIMERGGLKHDQERVFLLSTTNGPERSALAALIAVLDFYTVQDVIERLYTAGRAVMNGVNDSAERHGIRSNVSADGDFTCRPFLRFTGADGTPSASLRTLFMQETAARGIFMPWVCPSFSHDTDEIVQTLEALDAACRACARALEGDRIEDHIDGTVVLPVFRKWNR